MKISTHILFILGTIIIFSCSKPKGYDKVKDAEIENSEILTCLGNTPFEEYIFNEENELKDTSLFKISTDSSLVNYCWNIYNYIDVDFNTRTLIGVGYNYAIGNSSKNGTASVKIYKNKDSNDYIINVFVDSADKGAVLSGFGQIWFSIPKTDENATFKFNRKTV